MAFPQSVKTEALTRSRRCCCICHQFAGLYVNVHHIVPASEGGPDTIDNAIVLCLRCHGEVGHYNPKHPIGNKYTSEELVRHRDAWHDVCERSPLPIFAGYPAGESPQKLIDERRWPALRVLLMQEIEQVRQSLDQEELRWDAQDAGALGEVLGAHESFCGGLVGLFMILCQNDDRQCVHLAVECLEKVANLSKPMQQPKLHLYPALLALYAGGTAAILQQTYKMLKALLYDAKVRDEHADEAAMSLTPWNVIDRKHHELLRGLHPRRFALSYRLCEVLRDSGKRYLFAEGDTYEDCFDKFEYFHNLAYSDLYGPFDSKLSYLWPPLGYFVIRRYNGDFLDRIEQDLDRHQQDWPPLRAGFLQGDLSHLTVVRIDLHERIRSFGNSRYSHNYP